MADIAMNLDPLDEFRLVATPASDRLPGMLFLAALVHGILIIGITFNAALSDQFAAAISLEVTIVAHPDQRIDRPDRAEYLAQVSQLGGGNTSEQVRPSAPEESQSAIDNLGQEQGDAFVDSTDHTIAADEILATQQEQDRKLADNPRDDPQPDTSMALALKSGTDITLPLPQKDQATLLIHDDNPLTARVLANRYWEAIFGIGIVRTGEEFGSQGERPIHPELLDWLATELVQSDWNVKQFLKLLEIGRAHV